MRCSSTTPWEDGTVQCQREAHDEETGHLHDFEDGMSVAWGGPRPKWMDMEVQPNQWTIMPGGGALKIITHD